MCTEFKDSHLLSFSAEAVQSMLCCLFFNSRFIVFSSCSETKNTPNTAPSNEEQGVTQSDYYRRLLAKENEVNNSPSKHTSFFLDPFKLLFYQCLIYKRAARWCSG